MSPLLSPVFPPRVACSRSRGRGCSHRPLYVLFCAKYRGGSAFTGGDRVPAADYFPLYSLSWGHTGCFCVSGATSLKETSRWPCAVARDCL
jgi:hypothetical protein